MDASTSDYRDDLADSLPDDHRHVWLRILAGDVEETTMDGGVAVRHQPRSERDFYADSVRSEKLAVGCRGHLDRLGDDHVDDGGDLEALQMGRRVSSSVFHLGVDCECPATVDHALELVRNKS